MPFDVPIPAIDAALRAVMAASASLTALLATKPAARGGGPAIYEDGTVPEGTTYPVLTIGAYTQVPFNSLSPGLDGYGWNCTVQIKVIGQASALQLYAVLNEILEAFPHGASLDVEGYGSSWTDEWNVQPMLKVITAGKVTLELPAILRVYVKS